ncbi:MAG: hypothetical protein B6U65_00520 [Candidatus Wolframiiraptor sp. EX4484-121]|nr:MAG: hypothetical protein B6U65_00520 [Candidatus Wolframiiraptor sp. EX4484-121]
MVEVEPVHGQTFFTLSMDDVFGQILVFDYFDPGRYYYRLLEDEGGYRREMDRLLKNMNSLLSREAILINGERVSAEALTINLDFRGAAESPVISFYIEFRGKLFRGGRNVYECFYDEGVAEYDYEVYWFLPRGSRIVEVETSTDYEVFGERFLVMWARRGDHYSGHEKIVFTLPQPQSIS